MKDVVTFVPYVKPHRTSGVSGESSGSIHYVSAAVSLYGLRRTTQQAVGVIDVTVIPLACHVVITRSSANADNPRDTI